MKDHCNELPAAKDLHQPSPSVLVNRSYSTIRTLRHSVQVPGQPTVFLKMYMRESKLSSSEVEPDGMVPPNTLLPHCAMWPHVAGRCSSNQLPLHLKQKDTWPEQRIKKRV